jgi:hypothetical protein
VIEYSNKVTNKEMYNEEEDDKYTRDEEKIWILLEIMAVAAVVAVIIILVLVF